MVETDRFLLGAIGGSQPARVALIPTASALEPGAPERWNGMGQEHFAALGAHVTPLLIRDRGDALDTQTIAALREADLFYFSGGDPQYLIETLRDTPAWETIRDRHMAGAAVAGCSAGAMMLGGCALDIRALATGQAPQWTPALGLLPWISVVPHFDRAADFVGEELFAAILKSAPAGILLAGVDEDTALVRAAGAWRVMGRQGVAIFDGGARMLYKAGEHPPLPMPQ
jgi:cyanophycinase